MTVSVNGVAISDGATLTVSETEVFNGASPVAWTDLDLSGVIGLNAAIVILKIASADQFTTVAVRKNGDTDEFYVASPINPMGAALSRRPAANVHTVVVALTDTVGKIEWMTEDTQTVTVDIMAYIIV